MPENTSNDALTIGELSAVTGLSVSAIRFYQRRGVLPGRDAAAGWQRFDDGAVDRLAVVELAKEAGFDLDEVVRLMDAFDADLDSVPEGEPLWRGLVNHKLQDVQARLARLTELHRLLADTLDAGALTHDRARSARAALGWSGGRRMQHLPVAVPSTPAGVESAGEAPEGVVPASAIADGSLGAPAAADVQGGAGAC